jgi:hypothetical protein
MSDCRKLADECLQLAQVVALQPQPLQDGSGWCVEVTWWDGSVEHIVTFGLETTARDWIKWEAPAFFRDNSRSGRPTKCRAQALP